MLSTLLSTSSSSIVAGGWWGVKKYGLSPRILVERLYVWLLTDSFSLIWGPSFGQVYKVYICCKPERDKSNASIRSTSVYPGSSKHGRNKSNAVYYYTLVLLSFEPRAKFNSRSHILLQAIPWQLKYNTISVKLNYKTSCQMQNLFHMLQRFPNRCCRSNVLVVPSEERIVGRFVSTLLGKPETRNQKPRFFVWLGLVGKFFNLTPAHKTRLPQKFWKASGHRNRPTNQNQTVRLSC